MKIKIKDFLTKIYVDLLGNLIGRSSFPISSKEN